MIPLTFTSFAYSRFGVQSRFFAMPPKSFTKASGHAGSRSCTYRFDEEAMVKALEPIAQLKKVDWRWDGLHYSRSKRGCGPDREQLSESAPVLKAILHLCPNGFPNLSSLRSVWLQLENRFGILENKTTGLNATVATATDVWKKMAKDVVDMARKQVVGGECRPSTVVG